MPSSEVNWKDIFALFSDDEDFQREFKRTKTNKRARNTYLNYLKKKKDYQTQEAIELYKKRRHDRRKKLKEETKILDDTQKQQTFRAW